MKFSFVIYLAKKEFISLHYSSSTNGLFFN